MIEIPDLDDNPASNYTKQYNEFEDFHDNDDINNINDLNNFHINDQDEDELEDQQRFKKFQFNGNGNGHTLNSINDLNNLQQSIEKLNEELEEEELPLVPPNQNFEYPLVSSSSQEYNSKISLPLTEDSFDNHVIELNTAKALHVKQNSIDNQDRLQFKLQESPMIKEKERYIHLDSLEQVDDNIDEEPEYHQDQLDQEQLNQEQLNQEHLNQEQLGHQPSHQPSQGQFYNFKPENETEERDILNDLTISPNNIAQLGSPISHIVPRDHTKPSPQLPPPISTASLQRLTLSNGEEYMNLRKGLATDLKSPAEYTLHIVFTQFVRHAERKLNLCLEYSMQQEPQVIELLAEGNGDDQFDNIISSLGYIARQKPKPMIDSVMFWRKSKSEVASLAAAEVERVLMNAKTNLSKMNQFSPSNPGIVKNGVNGNGTKSKRSLSLMRSKSLSRVAARDHRRNQSASSVNPLPESDTEEEFLKQKAFYDDQFNQARETAIQAERKSLASIYILCRVLIELVKQTSSEIMGDDLGGKLEEIVYTQLKTTDPITTSESLLRSANWNLFAELLGHMSHKRFLSVSDRFIADLEKIPVNIDHDDEPRLHLLIHGMRYLKLTNYPLEVFEESAEFIDSLGKFFNNAQNELIILAYCEVLSSLLLPLANILTAETNHPTWTHAIEKIFNKAYLIWSKCNKSYSTANSNNENKPSNSSIINLSPNAGSSSVNTAISNSWDCSINLITASLSVSHKELFQNIWFDIIEQNMFKLRPKVEVEEKITFITCIDRLLWVYIFRLNDTLNNTIKKLDNLFQLLFFNNIATNKKQQWITSDIYLINSLIELLRIVGYKHLNYILDNVIVKLLKLSFNGLTLENLQCEKVILVVKSYLTIIKDNEINKRPEFPTDDKLNQRLIEEKQTKTKHKKSPSMKLETNDFSFSAKNPDNHLTHEEICKNFGLLLKLLDNQYGCEIWKDINGSQTSTPLSSTFSKTQSPFSAFHFGIDFSYQVTKNLHLELFATLIDSIPWTMVPINNENNSICGIQFKTIIEILTRNSIHSNFRIANSSINSLKKLASKKNPISLMNHFGKIAFQFSEKPNPNYNSNYLNSIEFQKLLKLYVELLNCWLKSFKQSNQTKNNSFTHPLSQDDELMSKDVLNDLYQINYKTDDLGLNNSTSRTSTDKLQWKDIITSIEDIEGNGLFFLCNQDPKIRYFGISILRLIEQFDQEIYNITEKPIIEDSSSENHSKTHSRSSSKFAADSGTRLINILENQDFLELIKPFRSELSVPERNRINKLKFKKSILIRLAESDYGIDTTLWFRIYPKLLDIFFEKCPMPVAICRSIVCVRLVQMHEQIFDYSESYNKNYTSSLFSKPSNEVAPEVLVDQWRLYLIFVCCSLTSTNEQKISFPSQPTHGRKRSMQIFIQHQKITSAKSIFRMVLPLLKSQQVMVKDSIISGLSCININIFKTLLENVQSTLNDWDENLKKRDINEDRLRIELINILSKITARFLKHSIIYDDDWIIANLVSIIKTVKNFLSNSNIQTDITFQKLRRYFCKFLENVFIGLENKNKLNRWLPFEARIGCFNYLKEWCGLGDSKNLTEERYQTMLDKSITKDLATSAAILEVERKLLQFSTLSCMATICSGNIVEEFDVPTNNDLHNSFAVMSFDTPGLMKWINSLLCSNSDNIHDLGKKALSNILKLNPENTEIFQEVLSQCYKSQDNPKTTESYYVTFVSFLMENKKFVSSPVGLYCLVTFLIGDDNLLIRSYSMKLLTFMESKFHNSDSVKVFARSVNSTNRVVYKKALFEISVHLASLHPEDAFERISYLTMCFNRVNNTTRSNILSCLLPWVQTVELAFKDSDSEEEVDKKNAKTINDLTPASIMVLNNLFEITVKFSSIISNEVEALWVALGSRISNFDIIVEYLITNSLERKNATFVSYARQIIDYLSFSQPDVNYMIDKLIANLQQKAMIPPKPHSVVNSFRSSTEFPYIANLWELIPYNEKDTSLSLGQLSIIFLVDLFTTHTDRMMTHLPLLLHIGFSLLDHYLPIVQEAVSTLLCHILHCLARTDPKIDMVLNKLTNKDPLKYLWVYDDLNNDKKGTRTPKNMDLLVRNVLEILTPISSNIQEEWSKVALSWATTCAVRHIACRSFQVFRSLLSILDQPMLKDMLHRLSNTISDETPDIQGFAMQILMTLNAINAELDSAKLIDFPQLFWSGVACLSTIHEQEFIEVLSAMSKFVSKIDLDSPDTVSCLISTFPPKWEGRFEGLQPVVMVGLRSSTSYEQTIKFLDKLNVLQDSEIITSSKDSRLLMTIIANLPRFLHALDSKTMPKEIEEVAMVVSNMSERNGKFSLAKIFVSLSKNRFRSKKDFLVQTITSIKNVFFPEFEAQTLVTLLGFLSNKTSWIKLETLTTLKYLMPLVDLQREEFIGVGADLISPLLRLLLTSYAEPALEVLDECVSISGSQLDKDVLRMSLGNSSMKKEYERTATLFGIPDDSGWSIPMPAVTASSTRNNVHAVFSTCTTKVEEKEGPNEEEFHFHRDDYYVPPNIQDNATIEEQQEGASLSHMWAALDDFDSFFTKENDNLPPSGARVGSGMGNSHLSNVVHARSGLRHSSTNHHTHSASVDTSNTSDSITPLDSAPFVYDKKASVILNRSLARTQSNTSFKNSLADSIVNSSYVNNTNNGQINNVNTPVSMSSRRSYIPFRSSRYHQQSQQPTSHPQQHPRDSYTTPVLPTSPTFEVSNLHIVSPSLHSPMREQRIPTGYDSQETIIDSTPKMLDSFLGGNKKRSKKQLKNSPNVDYMRSPSSSSVKVSPPSSSPSMNSTRLKEKKRGSQKLK
ncbi:cell morphogenesis protein PAG1 [[Candida] jaroonii]|uniref:Cell morphogenesis protein PAG1 n=1 Tax=[Candida] jaroonii TaxID=467808 RepID=A0ACA9Y7D7_9ASCO|nr:cell morphogenesis protein PAG1 [[Candida] jaroonii]